MATAPDWERTIIDSHVRAGEIEASASYAIGMLRSLLRNGQLPTGCAPIVDNAIARFDAARGR